jgi:uncharacterized membrane protein (DUF2068 family)
VRGRKRPTNRYELLTCGWRGHVLVGTDAAVVEPSDAALVIPLGGVRLHRCLRCDSYVARPVPEEPARPRVPGRDEIELPLRGPLLRDRYVLRLIALDRLVHVVVLLGLAVAIFALIGHRRALRADYDQAMTDLSGFSGAGFVHGLLGHLHSAFTISTSHLYIAGAIALGYAALEATEAVGLWLTKRWAEYLTFVATILFIPLEIYELAHRFSWLKLVTFALNVAIAAWLLWAKRLFGLRGGGRAEAERRRRESGWEAIDAATPVPAPTGPEAGR